MINIKKKARRYIKEFFKAAEAEGIRLICVKVRHKFDAELNLAIVGKMKFMFKFLDSIFIIQNSNGFEITFGVKSIIGHNLELLDSVEEFFRSGLPAIEIVNFFELNDKQKKNRLIESIVRGIPCRKMRFIFNSYDNRCATNFIYDMVVTPAQDFNTNISIAFFQQTDVYNKFIPIITTDYKYAVLNLIRYDFMVNNLSLSGGEVKQRDFKTGLLERYKSFDEYLKEVSILVSKSKKEFNYQLNYINLPNLLIYFSELDNKIISKTYLYVF